MMPVDTLVAVSSDSLLRFPGLNWNLAQALRDNEIYLSPASDCDPLRWQPQLAINIGSVPFTIWNPGSIWGQQPEYDQAILQALTTLNKETLLYYLLVQADFKAALAEFFSERAPTDAHYQTFFELIVSNSTQMSYQDAIAAWSNSGNGSGAGNGGGGTGEEEPGDPNANPPLDFNPYVYYFTQYLDRERDLPILLEAEASFPVLDTFLMTKFSYFASLFFVEELWQLVGGQLMSHLDTTIVQSLLANHPEVCQHINQNLDITFLNSLILKHATTRGMTQATGSSFFSQAMAVATANTSSTALPELLAFVGSRLGQARANQLIAKVGHLLTVEQQYSLKETYLYGSSRLGVKNQSITLSSRVASIQNGSLTPVGNAMLNTDSVFSGTATALGLPIAPSSRVFHRSWGLKQYELSNHLGNVQVTVSDKKIGVVGSNNVNFTSYQAEIKSATDYYAYGMEMPGKTYQSTAYRYGMNTQEKDNEIYGPGNVFSALYWEYDARIGRRWNVDPVVKEYEGGYTAFSGNPIWFVDVEGSDTDYVDVNGANLECRPGGADVTIKESVKAATIVAERIEKKENSSQQEKPKGSLNGKVESFSFGFAFLAGISVEFGQVEDYKKNSAYFYTVSANFGFGIDFGYNQKEVIPNRGKTFETQNYEGRGKNLTVGFLFTSESRGGNTDNNPTISPFEFGLDYKERTKSFSPIIQLPFWIGLTDVGVLYQFSDTKLIKSGR